MTLKEAFQKKDFVITCELSPPKGNNPQRLLDKAKELKSLDLIDGVNITDGQGAKMRMSSLVASYLVQQETGLEAICQLVTRDRNQIALQSDILGASSLGLRNYLCLSGDKAEAGDHPNAREVFELSSEQLFSIFASFQAGKDLNSNTLDKLHNPEFDYFLASATHPGVEDLASQAQKMKNREEFAGVSFFQSQIVYDLEQLEAFAQSLESADLKKKTLIGLTPIKSLKMARFLNEKVYGVSVPLALLRQVENSSSSAESEEIGISYTKTLLEEVRRLGFKGVHLMPIGFEDKLGYLIQNIFV